MGDWNISRRRYYGLPLPFYPCSCGHLNVIGSKEELRERAVEGFDQLAGAAPPVDRPRPDPLRGVRRDGGARGRGRRRVARRRASSRSRRSAGRTRSGSPRATRPAPRRGSTHADLPDHAYWEQWFPADWVSEMREQIRLWFYSQLFMSVVLVGRSPFRRVLGYEKMLDEHGREMHGSWGNMIDAEDAFARMGADVMRWQYCAQPPDRNLLFGFGPGARDQAQAADALELGRSSSSTTGTSRASSRRVADLETGPPAERPLDRWLVARTHELVREATEAYEATLTVDVIRAFEAFVDDLSNWYIRRSRRRFYGRRRRGVPDALVRARPGAARRLAGDAVPRRAPVAEPRPRRAGVGVPRRLAGDAPSPTARSSTRSPRCAASSSSAGRRARPPGSSCASRCGGSSSRAPRGAARTRTRSPTSCA